MNSKRAMAQLLRHLCSMGVTHLPAVQLPKARPAARPGGPAAQASSGPSRSAAVPEQTRSSRERTLPGAVPGITDLPRPRFSINSPKDFDSDAAQRPERHPATVEIIEAQVGDTEDKRSALCRLAEVVAGCQRCPELAETRRKTVFGVGNPSARIMFLGEAPGADEDAQGEPFVGEAGQLLNRIIESCRLKRDEVYICNILRCRPPGNRNPLPQEAANCREYLDAQIHLVQPQYIVCLGAVAAQNLLTSKRPVSQLRGKFHDHQGIKVLCTYHPAYLLRNPSAKSQVWEDMKFLMKDQGIIL